MRKFPLDLVPGEVVQYTTAGSVQTARVTKSPLSMMRGYFAEVEAENVQDYPGPVTLRFDPRKKVTVQ